MVTRVTSEERRAKLERMMVSRLPQFLEAAPAGFDKPRVERLLSQAAFVINADDKLFRADVASIFIAVRHAVELGLELSGAMPGAWLIPFWSTRKRKFECELMIGYQGMIDLAYRSKVVKLIESRVVYGNDEFSIDYGNFDKPLTHIPELGTERGEIDGAYAMAYLEGMPRPVIEWMPVEDIFEIRDKSKSKEQSPWDTHFAAMARKCPIRSIFKHLPKSPAIDRMLEIDRRADGLASLDGGAGGAAAPASDKPSNSDRLRATLVTPGEGPRLDRSEAQSYPEDGDALDIRDEDIPF